MKAVRGTETTEADVGSARLSADEERLEALELRGNSRMTGAKTGAGGLEALSGRDIDLTYLPDGQTLEHVLVAGDAAIQLAGESGQPGRRITSNLVDIALGPDGSSPTALTARENVELTLPAEPNALARTIRAQTLDGTGEAGKGLTRARFAGNVLFRERGPDINREARSQGLQVALTPGAERDRRRDIFRGGPFHGPPDDSNRGRRPIYRDARHARSQRHRAGHGNASSRERAACGDGDPHRRDAYRPVAARRRHGEERDCSEQARATAGIEGHEAARDAEAGSAGDCHGRRTVLRRAGGDGVLRRECPALSGRNLHQGQHHRHRREYGRSCRERGGDDHDFARAGNQGQGQGAHALGRHRR